MVPWPLLIRRVVQFTASRVAGSDQLAILVVHTPTCPEPSTSVLAEASRHKTGTMTTGNESPLSHVGRRGTVGWVPFAGMTYVLVVLLASSNLPTPLYPVYERVFALSPLLITLVFATYALVVIPSLLVFGPLSDAIGRRRIFVAALVGALVSMALFAAANGVAWLFAAQLFEGMALSALQGSAAPALIETDPRADRRLALQSGLRCHRGWSGCRTDSRRPAGPVRPAGAAAAVPSGDWVAPYCPGCSSGPAA